MNYQLSIESLDVMVNGVNILTEVNMAVKSGELLAIMGPTGAGKSTLLNAVAGRIPVTSGKITLNGFPVSSQSRPLFSFVLQEDVFMSRLTLYEILYFTAMIKIPETVTFDEKNARIYEVVDSLDLRKCLNTVVGDLAHRGMSGGEKKRLSIACELLSDPNIMLIDEPTSGLDSNTALKIMAQLKRYSTLYNKIVIASIHQPSGQIYDLFTKLLLLMDGKTVYFGKANMAIEYFEGINLPCAIDLSAGEFLLTVMKSDSIARTIILKEAENRRYFASMEMTDSYQSIMNMQNQEKNRLWKTESTSLLIDMHSKRDKPSDANGNVWPTSFWTQLKMLIWRQFKQSHGRQTQKIDIASAVFTASIVGLLYFQIDLSYKTLRDKMGAVFFCAASWLFRILPSTIINFHADRNVIWKERNAMVYRLSAYYFGKIISELPFIIFVPVLFYSIVYWMSSIGDVVLFVIFVSVNLLFCLICQSIGQVVGSGIVDLKLSTTSAQFYIAFSILLSGFYNHHTASWFKWAKYISIIHYPYACINILMTDALPALWCNSTSVELFAACKNATFITKEEMLKDFQIDKPFYFYIATMLILLVILTIFGYFVLKWQKY